MSISTSTAALRGGSGVGELGWPATGLSSSLCPCHSPLPLIVVIVVPM